MNRALQVEGLPAWQQAMAFEPRMAFALVARYLQGGYSTKTLGLSGAANTLCGLRRRLILAVGNGELDAGTLDGLHVLWRMVGRWKVVEPNEFRLPVPMNVCNAVISLLIDAGHHGAAVCILLSFYCLLRSEEVKHLRWRDIRLIPRQGGPLSSLPLGVICIRRPKMRGRGAGRVQYVTLNEPLLALYFAWLLSAVPDFLQNLLVWPLPDSQLTHLWDSALDFLGLAGMGLLFSGLRGGGATMDFLVHSNVLRLLWRGRWAQLKTLEHYLQEGVFALMQCDLPVETWAAVENWSSLMVPLLSSAAYGPPARPLTPPATGLGGRRL